jgi:hypothetical protein
MLLTFRFRLPRLATWQQKVSIFKLCFKVKFGLLDASFMIVIKMNIVMKNVVASGQ